MRAVLTWLVASAVLPAALAAAEPAPTLASFAKSVEATKQAMMADPARALESANAAVVLARRLPPGHEAEVAVLTAEWLHGEALLFMNKLNEAEPIVSATLARCERIAPNTKLHGDLLRSHGAIAASAGRVLEALHDYQRAHEVFRAAGQARSQAIALQDIGQIYWEAGDYKRVLDYYQQSAEVYSGDPTLTLTMQNNLAEVYRKEKKYREAATAYRAALFQATKLRSPLLQARILTNLAGSEAEAGRLASAQAVIDRAALLTSHGEAAGWQPFVHGTAASIAFDRGDRARAKELILRTFANVDINRTEMLFRTYHQFAARIFEASGDEALALAHLKAFQRLDSEAQALTATAASQLLAARFDFANQNLKISTLKQGQLQRDIQLERQRGRFRTMLFVALLVAGAIVLALLLVGFVSLRRSRNKVSEANARLSHSNQALETALRAKTEFLATTSHEIRTPLNGILGMTQVMLTDRRIQPDVLDRIKVVHGAGETMRALVDDILDVAKMESGNLSVEREVTDVRAILTEVAQLWQGQASIKGLALLVDVRDLPERIVSDGARIRQIAFNLMSNAIKFTRDGHVSLTAHTLAAADGSETIVVSVSDTGMGIPADKQEDIFEAFRQLDGGITREFAGTGLGLAICRNLSVALGGDLTVESSPGNGATFTLRLPVERQAGGSGAERSSGFADATVLIVDNDPSTQGVLRVLLSAEVARADLVESCAKAADLLSSESYDHVVVNAGTAGSTFESIDDLRAVLAATGAVHARTTLLVSRDGTPTVAEMMLLGATQIIMRPFSADDLLAALSSLYGDDPEPFVAPALFAAEAA
jgi:signal transduction histidine kinase/ActR/RegA family two-component response regulator